MTQQSREHLKAQLYSTNDLALSSALLAMEFILQDMDFSDPRKTYFVFVEDQKLREAINSYWSGRLQIEPRLYFNTLKDLKSRIYNQKYA